MDKNRFKLVGTLVAVEELIGIVETKIQGASRVYEDQHVVHFANPKLLKEAQKAGKKSLELFGRLAKMDNSDTYALVGAVSKSTGPHANLAWMEAICDLYEFMPATADKKQMGRMAAVCNNEYFTIMAFRGLAAKLDARAEMGTKWEVIGRLSPREFEQNGEIRNTVDLIARTAKLLKGSGLRGELAELDKVAMAFGDDNVLDDGGAAEAENLKNAL